MYNKSTECEKMRNTSKFFKKTVSVILSIFLVFPITNAYDLHTELKKFFDTYNKTSRNSDNTEETWNNFWYLIYLYQRVLNIVIKSDSKSSKLRTKLGPDLVTLAYKLLEKNNNEIPKRSFVKETFWDIEYKNLRIYEFDKTEFLGDTYIEKFLKKFNSQETYEITDEQRKVIDSIDNYSMPVIITNDNEPEYTQAKIISISDACSDSEDMDFNPKTNLSNNKIIEKRSNLKENLETAGILTGLVTVFLAGTYVISKSIKNIYQEIVKDKNNNKLQKRV